MRFRCHVEFEQRILLAVLHLDLFPTVDRGAGDELEPASHVLEYHFAVRGMDAFFHVFALSDEDLLHLTAGNSRL
jgi:hypothetical protein